MTLFIVGAFIFMLGVVVGFVLSILSIGLCGTANADKPK